MKIVIGLGRKVCCNDSVEIVNLGGTEPCPTCGIPNSKVRNDQARAAGKELGIWMSANVGGCYLEGLQEGLQR